jgi:hypothetical protein
MVAVLDIGDQGMSEEDARMKMGPEEIQARARAAMSRVVEARKNLDLLRLLAHQRPSLKKPMIPIRWERLTGAELEHLAQEEQQRDGDPDHAEALLEFAKLSADERTKLVEAREKAQQDLDELIRRNLNSLIGMYDELVWCLFSEELNATFRSDLAKEYGRLNSPDPDALQDTLREWNRLKAEGVPKRKRRAKMAKILRESRSTIDKRMAKLIKMKKIKSE